MNTSGAEPKRYVRRRTHKRVYSRRRHSIFYPVRKTDQLAQPLPASLVPSFIPNLIIPAPAAPATPDSTSTEVGYRPTAAAAIEQSPGLPLSIFSFEPWPVFQIDTSAILSGLIGAGAGALVVWLFLKGTGIKP